MHFKRSLALLLALLMLVIPLVSCSKNGNSTETEPPVAGTSGGTKEEEPTEDPNSVPNIPEGTTFGDKVIKFLTRKNENVREEFGSNQNPDVNSTVIAQKVFARNEKIQEKLKVSFDFKAATAADGNDYNNLITNSALMDDPFDIVSNKSYESTRSALLDCYMNFYDESLTYLDLSKNYWNQKYISAADVNGNLYTLVGDINISVYMCMFCMFFNINKCEAQGWETDELFDTVIAGDWTWAKLEEYVKAANVNPDMSAASPLYALYSHWYSHAYDGFLNAFELKLVATDPDNGKHTLVSGSTWSKMQDAGKMIYNLYNNADHSVYLDTSGYGTGEKNLFDHGMALFSIESVNDAHKRLINNLADEYGLLPLPKYNSNQKEYYTGVQDNHNTMSVMKKGGKNYAAISAVLEMLSAASYTQVRPYYVETLVKNQYLDDPKSAEIVDIVLDGANWDFGQIYASYLLDNEGGKAPHDRLWRAGVHMNELVTRYEKYKDYWNKMLQAFDSDPHFQPKA